MDVLLHYAIAGVIGILGLVFSFLAVSYAKGTTHGEIAEQMTRRNQRWMAINFAHKVIVTVVWIAALVAASVIAACWAIIVLGTGLVLDVVMITLLKVPVPWVGQTIPAYVMRGTFGIVIVVAGIILLP